LFFFIHIRRNASKSGSEIKFQREIFLTRSSRRKETQTSGSEIQNASGPLALQTLCEVRECVRETKRFVEL
jgi:hypothetical protein